MKEEELPMWLRLGVACPSSNRRQLQTTMALVREETHTFVLAARLSETAQNTDTNKQQQCIHYRSAESIVLLYIGLYFDVMPAKVVLQPFFHQPVDTSVVPLAKWEIS